MKIIEFCKTASTGSNPVALTNINKFRDDAYYFLGSIPRKFLRELTLA